MIEQHVTSREVSEALQKAGLKLESEYYWWERDTSKGKKHKVVWGEIADRDNGIQCYLATELLEWMPGEITENDFVSPLRIEREVYSIGKVWRPTYTCSSVPSIIDVDLPDALGKMCLYLLDNKLV